MDIINVDGMSIDELNNVLTTEGLEQFGIKSRLWQGFKEQNAGNTEIAISYYNEVISEHPDYPEPFFYRARAMCMVNSIEQAISDLDKAILLKQDYAAALNYRGQIKLNIADYDNAITDLDQALCAMPENAPERVDVQCSLGIAMLFLQQFDLAIADFDKSISLNADNPETYYYRASAKHILGDYEGAIEDYNSAITKSRGHHLNALLGHEQVNRDWARNQEM